MSEEGTREGDSYWQLNKTPVEALWHMFENDIATDVTFVINGCALDFNSNCSADKTKKDTNTGDVGSGDAPQQNGQNSAEERDNVESSEMDDSDAPSQPYTGERIRAHKMMLIARSPVFEAMFMGPLAEKSDTIAIKDCDDPEAFRQMLRFMYTGETELTDDSVMQVLYLARKYMLPDLIGYSMKYAKHCMNPENVCRILEQAIGNCEDEIITSCMTLIERQTTEVLQSGSFPYICAETLGRILDLTMLCASEGTIFESCVKWSNRHLDLDGSAPYPKFLHDILGDCLYKINFQNMTCEEFSRLVSKPRILPLNDTVEFYDCISQNCGKNGSDGNVPDGYSSGRSNQTYRVFELDPKDRVDRFGVWGDESLCYVINVACNRKIKLTSIRLKMCIGMGIPLSPCFMAEDLNSVKVNDVPCCQRITYHFDPQGRMHEMLTQGNCVDHITVHLNSTIEASDNFDVVISLKSQYELGEVYSGSEILVCESEPGVEVKVTCGHIGRQPVVAVGCVLPPQDLLKTVTS